VAGHHQVWVNMGGDPNGAAVAASIYRNLFSHGRFLLEVNL
jgi:hypothetical protein